MQYSGNIIPMEIMFLSDSCDGIIYLAGRSCKIAMNLCGEFLRIRSKFHVHWKSAKHQTHLKICFLLSINAHFRHKSKWVLFFLLARNPKICKNRLHQHLRLAFRFGLLNMDVDCQYNQLINAIEYLSAMESSIMKWAGWLKRRVLFRPTFTEFHAIKRCFAKLR